MVASGSPNQGQSPIVPRHCTHMIRLHCSQRCDCCMCRHLQASLDLRSYNNSSRDPQYVPEWLGEPGTQPRFPGCQPNAVATTPSPSEGKHGPHLNLLASFHCATFSQSPKDQSDEK